MFDHIVVAFFLAVLFLLVAATIVVLIIHFAFPRVNQRVTTPDVYSMANNLTTQLAGWERKNVFISLYNRNNVPCVQVINVRTCDNVVYELSSVNKPVPVDDARLSSAIHRLHVAVQAQIDDNKLGNVLGAKS